MKTYRISKYDPALRNVQGEYERDEWSHYGQIGDTFWDGELTVDTYELVERAYTDVALAFLRESNVKSLITKEVSHNSKLYGVEEGERFDVDSLDQLFRLALREIIWARFESEESYVHFGWDFNLYLGVSSSCPFAEELARQNGLFVEEFQSPYLRGQ